MQGLNLVLCKRFFGIILCMIKINLSSGFCSGDRSNVKVTSSNGKVAHVTWDTSHTTCNPNVIGYTVHYNFVLNGNIIYKSQTVNGERTGNTDVTTFPNFKYIVSVNPRSITGELKVPRPELFNFTAQKEVPGAAPGGLSVVSVSSDKISIKWDKLGPFERNGNIFGYQIYYKAYQESAAHIVNITGENTLTADLTGLLPSSRYGIFIRAIGEIGYSTYRALYSTTKSAVKSSTPAVTKAPSTSSSKTLIIKTTKLISNNPGTLTSAIPKTTQLISNNPGTLTSAIPKKSNSIIYTATTAHATSRRSLASQTITSTTDRNDYSSLSTDASTTFAKGPESDNHWDRILLIVGIAFGILLLIAICVPIVLHLCRCCDKGVTGGSTSSKEKEGKSSVPEKNVFKNIKNDTRSPPLPVTRLRRQASTLSRQQSYELKSDSQRSVNDYDSYDKFPPPAREYDENEGNYFSETDIESVSDGVTSDYHPSDQRMRRFYKPEFKVWPQFQNNPYKSRLIDFWMNEKFEKKNKLDDKYPEFPPGFLHTDFNVDGSKWDRYSSRDSGRSTVLTTEDLQYHSRLLTDDEDHGLVDTTNNYRGLENRVDKANKKPIQPVISAKQIPKTGVNKKQAFDRTLQSSPTKHNKRPQNQKDKFDHVFSKRLKNTNNVYIHNFMAFKGMFPKHPRHSQVFPVRNPAYDSGSNSDETETGTYFSDRKNRDYEMDEKDSKLRAIAYEQVKEM